MIITEQNNIVVVGQGAMGLLWYHHLTQSVDIINKKVSLLASNQGQLQKSKYQFTPYLQERAESYSLIYSQKTDITSANIIILCLKSFKITDTIKALAKDISPHCIVILAHNGMGTFETIADLLPRKQIILAMLTTHGCLRNAPLSITHTGLGQSDIGPLSGQLSRPQQEHLVNQLNCALPQVNFHQDIIHKQWLKLAINCVINPITAINNIDNGEVNNDKFTKQINALLTEITEVSQAENIHLLFSDLLSTVHNVAHATAKNCSSMRSDVLAGRLTEIDYINGFIHRLGKKNNVATPENTRLWQQITALT